MTSPELFMLTKDVERLPLGEYERWLADGLELQLLQRTPGAPA